MKKYRIIIFNFLCLSFCMLNAQVSINSEDVTATLNINKSDDINPEHMGVIIPRVESLNTTDLKNDGLLVFLNNPNPPLPTGEENGFYYWDATNNEWVPWQARYIAETIDKSQFLCTSDVGGTAGVTDYFTTSNGSFGSNTTTGIMNDASNPAGVNLKHIQTNNPDMCTLEDGNIIIHKTGWYYFQISITLTRTATPENIRDIVCVGLKVNDSWPTSLNGYETKGCNSYPNASGTTLSSNTFTLYTPLKLEEGDIVKMICQIDWADPCAGSFPSDCDNTNRRKTVNYAVTNGTIASLSGRYLGNF